MGIKYKTLPVDMVFERRISWIGVWEEDSTELDDIAYYLFLKYFIEHVGEVLYVKQDLFIKNAKNINNFSLFYNKANILLREQKIKNIKNNVIYNR